MRILRLLFILSISAVNAQNLKPACQVGAIWNYIGLDGGTGSSKAKLYSFHCIKDTIIGSHSVSVIKTDSATSYFYPFSYLAKDDSDALYFFIPPNPNQFKTYVFKEGTNPSEYLNLASINSSTINIETMFITLTYKVKVYTDQDSTYAFFKLHPGINRGINRMHPKYLSLYYGTTHTPFFGTLDFSSDFDSYYYLLNCYSDSSGTTKFIQKYASHECDYLGLKDILETKDMVSVFPNPCSDKFFISESLNSIINHIEVTNVLGEKMMESNVNQSLKQQGIDVSQWQPGIYFVNLRGNQINTTQKLIVHH